MLEDCPSIWGYATVLQADPRIEVHHDVLFVPGGSGGLFDRGRRLIAGSGYYRGLPSNLGLMSLVHGAVFSPIDPDTVLETLDEPVAFGGVLIAHFGHFLVGTLPRFWSDATGGLRQIVINADDLNQTFALPAYKAILPTLGMQANDFFTFDRPIRLRQVTVAYPCFEENNLVHDAFARMCKTIGAKLCPSARPQSSPIFLSKARLASGITRVENETELCEWLEKRDVQICYPETMPLADQIALFKSGQTITGFMGSAFHLSAFAPNSKLLAINHSPEIISNQVLIDKICGNRAKYVFSGDTFTAYGEKGAFQRCFRLNNVERTGGELLQLLEAQT